MPQNVPYQNIQENEDRRESDNKIYICLSFS